jgi:hypothetical protein
MTHPPRRTEYATKAVGLADLFRFVIGAERVAGPVVYRVELAAPEGESTGGGKQAIQHINLIPETAGGVVVVAGAANQVTKTVELRSHARLAEIHAQRFKGARLPLDAAAYTQLLDKMRGFFAQQGLATTLMDAEAPPVAAGGGGRAWMWVLVALVVAGGVAAGILATR